MGMNEITEADIREVDNDAITYALSREGFEKYWERSLTDEEWAKVAETLMEKIDYVVDDFSDEYSFEEE